MNPAPAELLRLPEGSSQNLSQVLRNPLFRNASAIVVADDRNDKSSMVPAADYTAARSAAKRKSRHARIRFRQCGLFFSLSLRAY